MVGWDEFQGVNQGYVEELYARFQRDPHAVDPAVRTWFERSPPPPAVAPPADRALGLIVGATNLCEAIRRYGHLAAHLDPLGGDRPGDPALELQSHGLTEDDLRNLPAAVVSGPLCEHTSTAWEAIAALRRIYSSTTGYDYAHIFVPEERDWLRDAAECGRFRAPSDPIDPVALLERLSEVEVFERFLHRTFPGKTRFSIEGLDMLVPVLDEVIGEAAEAGTQHVLIGMPHRGRLNVLAHVLHKPYAQILAEFMDPLRARRFHDDLYWTGDVKYHLGAHRAIRGGPEVDLTISMPPNPSHLEAIDPVVAGMARAAGTRVDRPGPATFDPTRTVPILIHGDASFPGQGIVAETLNLSRLPGYQTGGTIHVIANNQLGFTSEPEEARSTLYASGLARGFKIPIVHVNADAVEACIEAARLAFAYRARFQKDFVIDLVGYRRHGHNEGDEPAFTQPLLSRRIADRPSVRELWSRTLTAQGLTDAPTVDTLVRERMRRLQGTLESLQAERELTHALPPPTPSAGRRRPWTAVPLERLRGLNASLLQLPNGWTLHRKLDKARERRHHALDDPQAPTIDWAHAEELALASILEDGIAIRLTGEDVERGTFSQRHAVLHDARTGATTVPLQQLSQARAAFEIHNSPLTENATAAFEYGYDVQAPDRLVVWEAQYGDFINGAQVAIDEFIVSARAKWGQTPALVLLLPHGHEGQGPDHASARPERFLQLTDDDNMRVANCTTAAQYFHLLRLQAAQLETRPLPLVVLTPKSLLRHPLVLCAARELAEGHWQAVIDDPETEARPGDVLRLVLCSGKVYADLATSERRTADGTVALCRLEQLYPFPAREVEELVDRYPQLEEVTWVQEEPENMGAWDFVRPPLLEILDGRWSLDFAGRPRSSSPAEGSAALHGVNQEAIIRQAFRPLKRGLRLGDVPAARGRGAARR